MNATVSLGEKLKRLYEEVLCDIPSMREERGPRDVAQLPLHVDTVTKETNLIPLQLHPKRKHRGRVGSYADMLQQIKYK